MLQVVCYQDNFFFVYYYMPESEIYSILLNSQNSINVVNNVSKNSYQYNINWGQIIPPKFIDKKFNMTFTMISCPVTYNATTQPVFGYITLNIGGNSNCRDQSGAVNQIIGNFKQQLTYNANATYISYLAEFQDNAPSTFTYPNNQIITVSFYDLEQGQAVTIPNYLIKLNFTPIL